MAKLKIQPELDVLSLLGKFPIGRLVDSGSGVEEVDQLRRAVEFKYGDWIEDIHLALAIQDQERCLFPDESELKGAIDAFVMTPGDPIDRRITRVGGTPFWTRSSKWPRASSGAPYQFAAQVYFGDSVDLVSGLPGDIVVVLCDPTDGFVDENAVTLHWFDSETDVPVPPQDLKVPESPIVPCHGIRFRTWDIGMALYKRMSGNLGKVFLHSTKTRIGSSVNWIQEPMPEDEDNVICTIGSVEYLYRGDRSSQKLRSRLDCDAHVRHGSSFGLMWGDAGSLYLVRDGGSVRPVIQFY